MMTVTSLKGMERGEFRMVGLGNWKNFMKSSIPKKYTLDGFSCTFVFSRG